MRKFALVAFLSVLSVPAMASCDALKQDLDAKLQAKGVQSYTLEVRPVQVAAAPAASAKPAAAPAVSAAPVSAAPVSAAPGAGAAQPSGKAIGTCDGGTKEIVYKRK